MLDKEEDNHTPKVACIIPTFNAGEKLATLLESLKVQDCHFDTYVIDSSSDDGTWEIATEVLGSNQVTRIKKNEFDHGATRQLLINMYPQYDYYVFLTQDAYLVSTFSISKLIGTFSDNTIGATYGRQLPHIDANLFAKHSRTYNYPAEAIIKSIDDACTLGIKVAFFSNSYSAYRRTALMTVGGFPSGIIFAEDMYVAGRMLIHGWRIAYQSDACCRHSHNYTYKEEFSRYFDMGVFHSKERWLRDAFGGAGREGNRFVASELLFILNGEKKLLPEMLLRNLLRIIGYKLGAHESWMPVKIKRMLGMHKEYWN